MDFSIGVSREEAKALEINGDQFICPSCQGIVIFDNKNINHVFENLTRYITFKKIIGRISSKTKTFR
jgi:hypothetical protein